MVPLSDGFNGPNYGQYERRSMGLSGEWAVAIRDCFGTARKGLDGSTRVTTRNSAIEEAR